MISTRAREREIERERGSDIREKLIYASAREREIERVWH